MCCVTSVPPFFVCWVSSEVAVASNLSLFRVQGPDASLIVPVNSAPASSARSVLFGWLLRRVAHRSFPEIKRHCHVVDA